MTLLIYDCDGVLVDSEPIANAVLAELMTSLGHPMTAAQSMRTFGGRSLSDVLALAAEILGRPIPPQRVDEAGRALFARFRQELQPMPGAEQAITSLPYRRCVASSSALDRLALSLKVTGLGALFGRDVFSATQVANGKPAPDLFLFAARSLGADPAGCIVIEDTARGIEAARRAGMAAIGFAGGGHAGVELRQELDAAGADIVIAAMGELPAAVNRLVAQGSPSS
jgi:HAD superfamily hydrolase (TIGR01509 family)